MAQPASEVFGIKAAVRNRDGMRCTECGISNEEHIAIVGRILDVHRLIPGGPYSMDGCITLCRKCHAPKPRSPRGSLPYGLVFFPKKLMIRAKFVADSQEISLAEYLSELLRPHVEKDLPKALSQLDSDS